MNAWITVTENTFMTFYATYNNNVYNMETASNFVAMILFSGHWIFTTFLLWTKVPSSLELWNTLLSEIKKLRPT